MDPFFQEWISSDEPPTNVPLHEAILAQHIAEDEAYDPEPRPVSHEEPKFLLQVLDLRRGTIISRPSAKIQSPEVCDVYCHLTNQVYQAHTPLLGCMNLTEVGNEVFMTDLPDTAHRKGFHKDCQQTIFLSTYKEDQKEQYVGVFPRIAQELVESAIEKNYLCMLQNVKELKRHINMQVENKINSCFDFTGVCEDEIPFIMHCIHVPYADYEDLSQKERKMFNFYERSPTSKVAIYPDGARRKQEVTSEDLQVIKDLTTIKSESIIRCIVMFVIQRTDIDRFQPSRFAPAFRDALRKAIEQNVVIINMVVSWTKDGRAYFVRDDLPCVRF